MLTPDCSYPNGGMADALRRVQLRGRPRGAHVLHGAGASPHCSVHGLTQGVLPPSTGPTTWRRTLQRICRQPVPQPRQRDCLQQAATLRPQQERTAGALCPHL